ncbi:MAG: aminotransferase class I/II-fold pyridoxal phosphate-dependent enzyme [Prochlorotrichaceae cyanobacterium]
MTDRFPLLAQLLRSSHRSTSAFHTPGHKQGQGILSELREAWGSQVFRSDLPELPELDNLLAPEGVLAEAQACAAETFQADRTWFLVNGSTVGVMAAILAVSGSPQTHLILPRNVHRSAITGLILSGANPIFVTPPYDPLWDLVGTVTPDQIQQALRLHPDAQAVLIVSPTYEGLCADVQTIAQICHRAGVPLIVDEAHGAHFGFHPQLPSRALDCGADVSIQSTHKTLSALTQAAMLHVRGSRVNPDRLQAALNLLHTTSPSYLLLASLDAAQYQMATQGEALWEEVITLANLTREALLNVMLDVMPQAQWETQPVNAPHLSLLTPQTCGFSFHTLDPTRLTIAPAGFGLTGFELDQALNDRFGVIAELVNLRHLTFLFGLGQTLADSDRFLNALNALRHTALTSHRLTPPVLPDLLANFLPNNAQTLTLPVLSPRTAYFSPQETVAISAAIDRISAELVCPYPPGIPALLPGEVITEPALRFLQTIQRSGGLITGNADPHLQTIQVVVNHF